MTSPTVVHLFSGSGGGALGFKRAGFVSAGAFEIKPEACRDFEMLTGEPATCADLHEMSVADMRRIVGPCAPDVVFTSPPCKGFSGCLPAESAKLAKYLRLNELSFRGIWLALEAWPERPPPLIIMENVPRIQTRGLEWLLRIEALLHSYGYSLARSTHDCGELGGLAQHRKRFLLVARHMEQVGAFLRVPASRRVRGIGEVLGELPVPLPGSTAGGPMHRLGQMIPKNWVRLALIPAGGDWRDLPERVQLPPRGGRPNGPFGVEKWEAPAHAVLGHTTARDSWGSVADPRLDHKERGGCHGVQDWSEPSHTVRSVHNTSNAAASIADPRVHCKRREGGHGVVEWSKPSAPVIAHPTVDNFPAQVADPRLGCTPGQTGHLGVQGWAQPSHTVRAHFTTQNGPASVADPRVPEILGEPFDFESSRAIHMVIRAADGTWHRPMTTLELAVLQGFPAKIDGEWLVLDGRSHASWRERIGNAVPPDAAEAMARSCRETLAAAKLGAWSLSSEAIWVRELGRVALH